MFAAQKMPSIFVQQQVTQNRLPTAEEVAEIARGVKRELELDAIDPNRPDERRKLLEQLYPPPRFHG